MKRRRCGADSFRVGIPHGAWRETLLLQSRSRSCSTNTRYWTRAAELSPLNRCGSMPLAGLSASENANLKSTGRPGLLMVIAVPASAHKFIKLFS